ncbi:hypothetical protein HPB49_017452 [Dermacentor silvarum]|uniref:Uncharacterized protein n=1 Tax=Dermacentor silvarum TaxID=543639 RepID=A0ACB8D6Z9_DERSI|nr:hypothetical protein HPB49_017452 [Dermacentor silvarum]
MSKDFVKALDDFKREMRLEMRSVKESVKFCSDTCDEIRAINTELKALRHELSVLLQSNEALKKENKQLAQRVDELEQYSRLNNLEIKGVKSVDNTNDVIKRLGEIIQEPLCAADIDTCHKIATRMEASSHLDVTFVKCPEIWCKALSAVPVSVAERDVKVDSSVFSRSVKRATSLEEAVSFSMVALNCSDKAACPSSSFCIVDKATAKASASAYKGNRRSAGGKARVLAAAVDHVLGYVHNAAIPAGHFLTAGCHNRGSRTVQDNALEHSHGQTNDSHYYERGKVDKHSPLEPVERVTYDAEEHYLLPPGVNVSTFCGKSWDRDVRLPPSASFPTTPRFVDNSPELQQRIVICNLDTK